MFTCANCGSVFSSKQRLQSHENSATACEKARKRAKIASQTFASPTTCSSKQIVAQIVSPHNSSLQRPAIPYVEATVAVNRRPASPATVAVNGPSNQQNPVVVVATDFATRTPTAAGSSQSCRPGIPGSSAAAVASRFSAKGVLAGRAFVASREPLPTESSHKTLCGSDGFYWSSYCGSKSRGSISECCRACRISHISNLNAAVTHIRNNEEMKCRCPVPGSCTCGKGIRSPLFVHSVCGAKRKRFFTQNKVECACEEHCPHDASFCEMDLLGFAASINREKVAKEAVFAKNSSDLKRVCTMPHRGPCIEQ